MRRGLVGAVLLAAMCVGHAETLKEWTFDTEGATEGWDARVNHISDARVLDGSLQGRIMDWDPWVTSPLFDIAASAWQVVEVRLKTDCAGDGQIYWTNTTETEYGGFTPGKQVSFRIIGDNEWHVYRIFPFWHGDGKIIMMRLDLARPAESDNGLKTFAVDWVRITELDKPDPNLDRVAWNFSGKEDNGWETEGVARKNTMGRFTLFAAHADQTMTLSSPPVQFIAEDIGDWLVVEMAVDKGHTGSVYWASEACKGRCSQTFALKADGQFHTYNVELSGSQGWSGPIMQMQLVPSDADGAVVRLQSLQVSSAPMGPPDIRVRYVGLENGINRVGQRLPFRVTVFNAGGTTCKGLRVSTVGGKNVRLLSPPDALDFPDIDPMDTVSITLEYEASEVSDDMPVALSLLGPGAPAERLEAHLCIEAPLHLPKADYVPEPQPVASDYEIGALYFPGWPAISSWARIWPVAPERKPILGWYDEGNPECVDWQIKWAVENGLSYFLVDWYWQGGGQSLDHWVKAFQKARYRRYLKWAMMWANHNGPGSHTEEDQRKVTRFWIENYFNTPEYYRIQDMPVVMIWSPSGMNNDMAGKGGVARLLDISQEMAREAGYKGIWFVAMKWPEASTAAKDVQWLADAGFQMTSIYHYMHHGGKAESPTYFPFDLVADSSYPFWQARQETGILPFLPNLSTGWDSSPWHGDRSTVVYGRTVEKFRRICQDAKRFADETGVKRMTLAPLNEWGEGSYAEPCKEFGFGMYEAVRETFCRKPAAGWPVNYGPADVGLGPYDLAQPEQLDRSEWDFSDGTQGWGAMMGIRDLVAEDGLLRFACSHGDPALSVPLNRLSAGKYRAVRLRLKAENAQGDPGQVQLFWSTSTQPITEASSTKVPLIADGTFRDYVLPVADNRRWRGKITGFRLDTGSQAGLNIVIDSIAMVPLAAAGN